MQSCPHCGSEMMPVRTVCPKCRFSSSSSLSRNAPRTCPACQAEMDVAESSCPECNPSADPRDSQRRTLGERSASRFPLKSTSLGAVVGLGLALVFVMCLFPGHLTDSRRHPDSDAGFILVLLGGFLAVHGAAAGVLVVELVRLLARGPTAPKGAGVRFVRVDLQLLLVVGGLILVIGIPVFVIVSALFGVHL
jgi:hypothetical protein